MPKREWPIPEPDALVLSQTTIANLEKSPCRVTTVPPGHKITTSEAMFFGTVEHGIVERVLVGDWSERDPLKVHKVLDFARQLAAEEDNEAFDLDARLNGHEVEWATELGAAWRAFWTGPWKDWLHEYKILEMEKPKHWRIGEVNGRAVYLVTGGVDMVAQAPDGRTVGVDLKTKSKIWRPSDQQRRYDGTGQDDAYALLLLPEYGLVEDWIFLAYDRSKGSWLDFPTQVTIESAWSYLTRLVGWADFLTLPHRPHLCVPTVGGDERAWWSKPDWNEGFCPTCRHLGDEHDERERERAEVWFS